MGPLEAWICSQCGHVEWHMELSDYVKANLANLARTPNAGVFWVDGTPPTYR